MTTPTNWPNPERPGYPMFPERSGLHVVLGPFDETPVLILWRAQDRTYLKGTVVFTPDEALAAVIRYRGPCFTPPQIADILAGERERCAKACEKEKPSMDDALRSQRLHSAFHAISRAAGNIRNLGAAP